MTGTLSRRDLFANLLAPFQQGRAATSERAPRGTVAVIQGRYCLAYQKSFCSTCAERCPVEGAIVVTNGIPRVNAATCNGCGICHELCPAPTNAVLLLPKKNNTQ